MNHIQVSDRTGFWHPGARFTNPLSRGLLVGVTLQGDTVIWAETLAFPKRISNTIADSDNPILFTCGGGCEDQFFLGKRKRPESVCPIWILPLSSNSVYQAFSLATLILKDLLHISIKLNLLLRFPSFLSFFPSLDSSKNAFSLKLQG